MDNYVGDSDVDASDEPAHDLELIPPDQSLQEGLEVRKDTPDFVELRPLHVDCCTFLQNSALQLVKLRKALFHAIHGHFCITSRPSSTSMSLLHSCGSSQRREVRHGPVVWYSGWAGASSGPGHPCGRR